jgi:mitochondrial fission protein ELM1
VNIWLLSDGKAGHLSQAQGLLAALSRLHIQTQVDVIAVEALSVWRLWLHRYTRGQVGLVATDQLPSNHPDLIIAVGHRTHWPLLLLAKYYPTARTLLLMQSSLPRSWFDLAIVPAHDQPIPDLHLLVTTGVLNPLVNQDRHEANRHLILIGGPSKRHAWHLDSLLDQLKVLRGILDRRQVVVSTSRRTPASLCSEPRFVELTANMQVCPVSETPAGWVFEQMQLADTVWVTEDSVSMIYEALTAGCRVGVIAMPRLKEDRITQGVDQLMEQGQVLPIHLAQYGRVLRQPVHINEADRAAAWLLVQMHMGVL